MRTSSTWWRPTRARRATTRRKRTTSRKATSQKHRRTLLIVSKKGPRVGLVLGAGGVMGGAWLTGGLEAIARETGWDPAEAEYIVGTSAGSMMGGLLASGVTPWFMVAHSNGDRFGGLRGRRGPPGSTAGRARGASFGPPKGPPPIGPGLWKLIPRSLSAPMPDRATALLAGWLPRGFI